MIRGMIENEWSDTPDMNVSQDRQGLHEFEFGDTRPRVNDLGEEMGDHGPSKDIC